MFADWVKIALKTALIVSIIGIIIGVITGVQLPMPDFTDFFNAVSLPFRVVSHYCPIFPTILTYFIMLMSTELVVFIAILAITPIRSLIKVNE